MPDDAMLDEADTPARPVSDPLITQAATDGWKCPGCLDEADTLKKEARGETLHAPGQRITHGRHCTCTPCRVEDWTNPALAPCGMHGRDCPQEYAPLGAAGEIVGGVPARPVSDPLITQAAIEAARDAILTYENRTDVPTFDYDQEAQAVLSAALPHIIAALAAQAGEGNPWRDSFPPGRLDAAIAERAWDNGRAAENARIVAALRAKGTHAADVLADQIEMEAP